MFYFTLPIIFTHSSLLTLGELLSASLALFVILYISSPAPELITHHHKWSSNFRQYLLSAWSGELSLWRVFWPFFILLNSSLLLVDHQAISAAFTVSSWDTIHLILVTPIIWWCIAIWRSSGNTRSRFWSALARLMIFSVVLEYLLKIIIRIHYPRIFFNCQELFLDYGGCF